MRVPVRCGTAGITGGLRPEGERRRPACQGDGPAQEGGRGGPRDVEGDQGSNCPLRSRRMRALRRPGRSG